MAQCDGAGLVGLPVSMSHVVMGAVVMLEKGDVDGGTWDVC